MSGTETTEATAAGTSLDTDLDHEFEQRGLSLLATADTPDLAGPFSSVSFAPADSPDAPPQIAVAITSGDDLEPFDQAVAGITASRPELAPSSAVSMASIDELSATLPQPITLMLVLQDGEPIGVVAQHADRRSGGTSTPDGAETAATETPATETAAPGAAPEAGGPADVAAPGTAPAVVGTANPVSTAPIVPIDGSFGLLQDVVLEVSVELGRSTMPLARLMNLGVGSIVELDRAAGAPVDVRVNGTLFAHGEVVVVDDEYAVRIIEILAPTK